MSKSAKVVLVSPDIQKLLKPASNLLDDVEGFFLAPEVMQHPPRSEQQMAEWLGHAANVLPLGGNEGAHTFQRMSCAILARYLVGHG